MAILNSDEVVRRLRDLGSDRLPEKQAYKSEIAGHTIVLFHEDGREAEVRAENAEHYLDLGMTVDRPSWKRKR